MLEKLRNALFNLKERFFHKPSKEEIDILINTGLFINIDIEHLQELASSIRLARYAKNTLICREGERGDACYIVYKGSVRVFVYNEQKVKIPLARLNKGDYFGEQALIGEANKTRNANIESIDNTTLIIIPKRVMHHLIDFDTQLKENLTKLGRYQESFKKQLLEKRTFHTTEDTPWVIAQMKKYNSPSLLVRSYHLCPIEGKFKTFEPGQYVIIQAKIETHWVERPYTISDITDHEGLLVTIKKEPHSVFTQWLFDHDDEAFTVNVRQPTGDFLIDQNDARPVVCFAGGVGITAFYLFIKRMVRSGSQKKLHLIYCALNKDDFLFTEELNALANNNNFLTIQYRETQDEGLISSHEILNAARHFKNPDIYICGPEGFVRLIHQSLSLNGYSEKDIHFESFSHAGEVN